MGTSCVFTVHAHRLIYMRYERLLCVRMNASIDYDWLNYSHVDDGCRCGSRPSLSSPQSNPALFTRKRTSALARGAIPLISFIIYCHYIYFWHLFLCCWVMWWRRRRRSEFCSLENRSFNVRCPNSHLDFNKIVSTRHSMQMDRYKVNWMLLYPPKTQRTHTWNGFSRTHFAFAYDGIF